VSQTALEQRLGAGGEAEVLAVPGRPDLAFKRYRAPSATRAAKLAVMLRHPPDDRPDIAWPVELVSGPGGVEGFLMRRVDLRRNVPVFQVYNPASRRRIAPAITWRYLVRTARNAAAIVDALHRAGYVVGDLNESNLLVDGRAVVTLVDCDSMQVRDPDGDAVFPCAVGKPEFTPPELHRADLSTTERTPETDAFALAVLVFLLLMDGTHPFASVWHRAGDPPDVADRIRRRAFAYAWWPRLRHRVAPPPLAVPLGALPWRLRRLVRRSFGTGLRWPARRPTAREWVVALDRVDARLRPCPRSPHHLTLRRIGRCPWCRRVDAGAADSFPGPERTGVVRRPSSRWRALAKRVPAPPASLLSVALPVTLAAVTPVLVFTGLVVLAAVRPRPFENLAGAARRAGASLAIAAALTPIATALVVGVVPAPSAFVLAARLGGMIAAGLMAGRVRVAIESVLASPIRRWRVAAAVVLVALCATRVAATWWPLRVV
jgi:DNA-binding helix-hairpin-helix protein with protein kinase domain